MRSALRSRVARAAAAPWLFGSVAAAGCGGGSCPAQQSRSASQPAADDIVIGGGAEPTAAVVFMHGLGDTGHGWEQPARMLSRVMPHVRFVLPSAPVQPVTLNGGMPMPSWYDIHGLTSRAAERCDGIDQSAQRIRALLSSIDVPLSKVVLAGFSQGGALALHVSLRMDGRLAGVASLSGYLPLPESLQPEDVRMAKDTPLLLCHGDADAVVRPEWARVSRDKLEGLGLKPSYHEYPGMGHELGADEFHLLSRWLADRLPPASAA
eukprot:TRINITY_DN20867_c0_g1_i1.p2 TRINITY_DN20867_c0_g1~~TRINITY_DN20867_c0_g1_i1.p2  ORF type:complete len:265 (+),score=85.21 TRINITY_DN20867_c0_g1_i1:77-871(+)